jgi:hypothetical protein
VGRAFVFTERFSTTFRAEAFNLTNTPQFNNPSSSATGGGFGYISGVGTNSNREMRFSLRANF